MKNVHSRETLMSIDYYPFENRILEQLTDLDGKGAIVRLFYQCICHYMNAFAEKYEVPTVCDVEKFFLTKQMILQENGMCEFYEDAEYNNAELLYELAAYCNWDYLCISQEDLSGAGLEAETKEDFQEQLHKSKLFTEKGKRLLERMWEAIVNGYVYEDNILYILSIKGLPWYLRYQTSHSETIYKHFRHEDRVIHNIVENIEKVLIGNFLLDYDLMTYSDYDSDEFLLEWITGSDGYSYTSIAYLNPNWLISMYVLHGLLGHAKAMFGYQLEGTEEK